MELSKTELERSYEHRIQLERPSRTELGLLSRIELEHSFERRTKLEQHRYGQLVRRMFDEQLGQHKSDERSEQRRYVGQ